MPGADRWLSRITFAVLAGAAPALATLAVGSEDTGDIGRSLVRGIAAGGAALLVLMGLERAVRDNPAGSLASAWFSLRPRTTVVAAAIVGTVLAIHPLLLGRSLVSPNTGGAAMLYFEPPYVAGSTDTVVESARGSDIGAMMWAILPYTVVQRKALSDGEWPLWNRYNTGGEPLWGQAQTFALDPLHAASLLVPDVALAMDLRFAAARAIFAAGIGLLVLAITGSLGAAVLLAGVSPFIGLYTLRLNHPAYFSLTYAPFVLLAYTRLARADSRAASARAAAWIAVASWLQLVGSTPKEGAVALAAAHAAGALGVFLARRHWHERLATLDILVITAVATVLATAPHWLIFLDGLSRAFTHYNRPAAFFLAWPDVVGFLIGAANPGVPRPAVHPLVSALAVAGLLQARALWQNPVARGCLLAAIVFWAVALGAVPAAALLEIPMLGNIYHVGLAFAAASIPLVLAIAGSGAARLLEPDTPRRTSIAVGGAVAVLGVVLAREIPDDSFSPARLMALYSILGATAVVLVVPLARRGMAVAWTAAMAVGVAAAVIAGGLTVETTHPALDAALMQPRPRVDLQQFSPALQPVVDLAKTGEPFRVAPFGMVMMPGTQAYWGLEGTGGPDAVRLPFLEDLSDLSGPIRTSFIWLTVLNGDAIGAAGRYLDMLNVRYLVSGDRDVPMGATALPVAGEDRIRVVERPTAWPRAFFVDGVERHDSLFSLAARLRIADAPFVSVDRSEAPAMSAVAALPAQATTVVPARDYRLTVNRTAFRVDAPGPGVIALSEAYVDRDFVVTLNGAPAPYFRVNHAFKGVSIPAAGTWEVAFEYRPRLWGLSWLLSAAGWLAIAGLAVAGRRSKRAVKCE